ncbi:glutamyl-tRNA reductase [Allostreptomyces psammosilenae]|uniref:Glutamyl-tRNA reductase n=1 Tax=Allostreptomyces psammosilenae TaxID=1892865 RepID=A0A852ZYG8_9ACTN|nr:glutamyl-tRNA reductase [Allostreptomyces psammosilenae]NYI05764.1 glutamyl-tRNA reductase [Allostreptomyces psammosilenae]
MSLLALGLSHRTAEVGLLERAALDADAQVRLLSGAVSAPSVNEVAVLATCNRIEVYADVEKFHGGIADLSAELAAATGVPLEELTDHLYVHYEDRAVHHLFSVACGLDSMVVGEGQILAQIKQALAQAQARHSAGRALNDLFQQSLRVGKRAHSETRIDRAGQSLVSVGLDRIRDVVGPLDGLRALVVGAGSMSSLAATTLARAGVKELVIANRTAARARRLADTLGAGTVPYDEVDAAIAAADLVVTCTGATGTVIHAGPVAAAVRSRRDGGVTTPLAILDLAMPRDVDPAARTLDGVHLVDLERLAEDSGAGELAGDVERVGRLVGEEVAAYGAAQRAARVTPTVVALRAMAAQVVDSELARLDGRLPDLDERSRAEVAQTLHRVVEKLLHAPTVRAKQLAADPSGADYAEALRALFDLDPQAVAAIGTARPAAGPVDGVAVAGAAPAPPLSPPHSSNRDQPGTRVP